MIWTALSLAGGFLKRVPWPVYAVAGALLIAFLWGNHRYAQGEAAVEARYAAARAQTVTRARKADGVAIETAQAETGAVEAGNAAASEAAKVSDDPLKAGLDSLGGKK